MIRINGLIFTLFLIIASANSYSQASGNKDSSKIYRIPSVSIIGDKPSILKSIPGSAVVVSSKELDLIKPINGNQVFQTITGLNAVDEEGLGLRLNVGIRGLDPDRSGNVLVLEDGIPVALAPYGEPEMYYTPSMDRMSGIEVLKGSGSIIYGPRTIGGVINYITQDPPSDSKSWLNVAGGSGGYMNAQAGYGKSFENMGFLIQLNRKQADNIGITNYAVNDIMTKFKIGLSNESTLRFKLGVYDENSNSTYVGLTQSMWDNQEYFSIIAPHDNLAIRRYSANLSHELIVGSNAIITTTLFGYTTERNWRRQDFSRSMPSNWTGEIFGDTSVSGGALYMRNSTGNRDRKFEVFGIQPQINWDANALGMKNEITAGIRLLSETAYEDRINGTLSNAISGNLVNHEVRSGFASSAFIQDRVFVNNDLIISGGLRLESFDYDRDIQRTNSKDTSIYANRGITSLIPGIGINYNIGSFQTVFAGVHRGFAPPRTNDAITNAGQALDLDAELSWNYEVGIRSELYNGVNLEITGFYMDFSNQIIPISESSGAAGTGVTNGGETIHQGMEFALKCNISNVISLPFTLIFDANATYANSFFSSDRFITVNEQKINIKDNHLPYAPNLMGFASLSFLSESGIGIYASINYVGNQFTDLINSDNPSPSGESGLIDARYCMDMTASYELSDIGIKLFVTGKNLTDERFIVSRRPQGIKVAIPRLIIAGIQYGI